MAGVQGATRFADLEALVEIPGPLRALWSRADGLAELLVMDGGSLEDAIDLMSVEAALRTLVMNREVGFPDDMVPFATEAGSGDCYALDAKGQVHHWDHERGEAALHAASLGVVIGATRKAVDRMVLFGGPERKAGEVDKKVLRLQKLIDGYLGDVVTASNADDSLVLPVEEALLYSAMETRSWQDALASLCATGGVAGGRDNWNVLGCSALEAGELEVALRAFTGGASDDSILGEHAVAWKLGRKATRSIEAIATKLREHAARSASQLAPGADEWAVVNAASAQVARAVVETLEGDASAARAALDEAYRRPLGARFSDPVEANPLAGLVGLAPRV
jgi:hypothetical protein